MHTDGVFILALENKMYDYRISKVICCQSVEHQWKLGNNIIENVSSMHILGVPCQHEHPIRWPVTTTPFPPQGGPQA